MAPIEFQVCGRRVGRALRLFALAVTLFAGHSAAATGGEKIAIVVSQTGASTAYGAPSYEGALLAIEEANAAGDGPRIAFDLRDDATDADKAKSLAHDVGASDAVVVIGPATTAMGLAAGPIYAEAGIACISTVATSDHVTDAPTFFRGSFSTSDIGNAIANYIHHVLHRSRALVIYKDDAYGQPVSDGFRHAADRLGITAEFRAFKSAEEAAAAAQAAAAEPGQSSIVLGMLVGDAAPILKVLKTQGVKAPILGTNSIAGEFLVSAIAGQPVEGETPEHVADGVYAATPTLLDSANAETLAFADRFRARFGHEASYIAVQGYEAALLAVAAVHAVDASGGATQDVKVKREAVRAYLTSLKTPDLGVPGLSGPLWFTPGRGREQPLRFGRFHDGVFVSAPVQLVPVAHPDEKEVTSGAVVDIAAGKYARRQQVIYTGLFLNEVQRIDVAQSTFTADFYLWMRYAREEGAEASNPADIDFPDLVRGTFDADRPSAAGELDDGTSYRLWHMRGDFKSEYDLRHYPFDRQQLVIRFFNSRAASDRLVYVQDRLSLNGEVLAKPELVARSGEARADELAGQSDDRSGIAAHDAFRNLTQWEPLGVKEGRDILVTESALGDPRLVGLERVRELSGFTTTVDVHRRAISTIAKTMLPLGLMTLILFGALNFPHGLVKEKITVAVTAALSGAVLLASINSQLGGVGYIVAIEYVFYVFFALCLLSISSVLMAERSRVAGRATLAKAAETTTKYIFLLAILALVALAWLVASHW